MAWGGFQNGRIPAWAMIVVRGEHFETQAGRQVIALGAAFKKHFHKDLIINDGYRDYAEQVVNWNKWVAYRNGGPWAPQAAYYGTSNHGWGRAADFGSGVQYFGTPEKRWMDANAPKYGWHPTGNGFSNPEAWHFDYTGNPIIVAGDDITIIEDEQEMKVIAPYGLPDKGIIAPGFGIGFANETDAQHFLNVNHMGQLADVPVTIVGGPNQSEAARRELFWRIINMHNNGGLSAAAKGQPMSNATSTVANIDTAPIIAAAQNGAEAGIAKLKIPTVAEIVAGVSAWFMRK